MSLKLYAVIGLVLGCAATQASDFPARRVTIVVPYSAGGGTDGAARALAKGLSQHWGKPVIVENVGGADGRIGTQRVSRAAPDGHTIVLSVPNLLLFKHAKGEASFDASANLTPISLVAKLPVVIIASNASGVKTPGDLKRLCSTPNAKCTWGSGEQFSWLVGKSFLDAINVESATNVPYRGTSPVVNDVLGGHLTFGVASLAAPLPHHKSGAMRIIGGITSQRYPSAPDVPTMTEAGVRDIAIGEPWYGLFGPKGMSMDSLKGWHTALSAMHKDADVAAALNAVSAQPMFSSPEEFLEQVRNDERAFDALLQHSPLPN